MSWRHDHSTDQSRYQSNLFSSHGLEQCVCKFFFFYEGGQRRIATHKFTLILKLDTNLYLKKLVE